MAMLHAPIAVAYFILCACIVHLLRSQECDDMVRDDVAAQVSRVRELEISAVRCEEAAKYRKMIEAERREMDRIYQDRLSKLRQREEELQVCG